MKPIQDIYQKAIRFAGEKHSNQKIKGSSANYLLHLSCVAMEVIIAHEKQPSFDLEKAVQIALLHDTLEDTQTTEEELNQTFGAEITKSVKALSKDNNIEYEHQITDSLKRINQSNIDSAVVKLADRITNLQKPREKWNNNQRKDYLEASKEIADALQNKHEALHRRLTQKIAEYKQYIS